MEAGDPAAFFACLLGQTNWAVGMLRSRKVVVFANVGEAYPGAGHCPRREEMISGLDAAQDSGRCCALTGRNLVAGF